MNRRTLLTYVLIVIAMGAVGCRDGMTGTLDVSETVALSSTAGPRRLPPGQYPVKITGADSGTLTIRIEPPAGDVIIARLKSKTAPDSEGDGRIPSVESGQPFDVTYQLSAFRSEAPLPATTESCTFDTTENRCRMVTDYDLRTGQSSERWECVQVPVTLRGVLTTSAVKVRSARRVEGQLLDPESGRQLAWLRADADLDRSYRASTRCAPPNR